MSPWRWRLALRRARVQAGLVSVVLMVSCVAATLAATLYLLDFTTTAHAANEGMTALDQDERSLVHVVTPAGTVAEVLAGSQRAAEQGLDPFTFDREVAAEGATRVVHDGETKDYVVGYLGYVDRVEDKVLLVDGRWPSDAAGPVEVIVPEALLVDRQLVVGDVLVLGTSLSDEDPASAMIVGSYRAIRPGSADWDADRLAGNGFTLAMPVPNVSGLVKPGYGPFLTTMAGVDSAPAARVQITYRPVFTGASLADIAQLPAHLADAETTLAQQSGTAAARVVVTAPVATSAGAISTSLAMTRSSVIVTGLLLLVVAIAALAQTVKLVGERRQTENHLMAARGASGAQGLSLGAFEAITLAALTVAVSVPAARLAFLAIAGLPALAEAGFDRDPGMPTGTWVTAGIVGLLLVALLSAPLLQRSHRLVEAENTKARPGKAGLQRAGIDVALLAVAGIAFWQLTAYTPPPSTNGLAPRIDPLLTAGPALALLAGALAVTRIVPAASHLLDGFASRGRSAVMPLAAWEVSRRPTRAASAVMLLTLAVSVGTFGLGYLATWTASQRDQALYLHPQDAVATATDVSWSAQRDAVSAPGADASPVALGTAELSDQSLSALQSGGEGFSGTFAHLVATDGGGWASLEGGRLDEARGYAFRAGLNSDLGANAPSAVIPDTSEDLAFTVTATPSIAEVTDVLVTVRALVEDENGERLTLDLGTIAANGTPHRMSGSLEGATSGVAVVGLQTTFVSLGTAPIPDSFFNNTMVAMDVTFAEASGLTEVPGWTVAGVPAPQAATPFSLDLVTDWNATAINGVVKETTTQGGDVTMRVTSNVIVLLTENLTASLTAAPLVESVPVVVSNPALNRSPLVVGDSATLRVGSTMVRADIVNTVPMVGGLPGAVVAADLDALHLALFQNGGSTSPVSSWWVTTEDASAYTASVPADVSVTTRDARVADLTTSPLRISIPTAVWLVVGAAALLAAIGFAVHVVVSTRARELELAQLSAVGLGRGHLVRMLTWETLLLASLGALFGLGLGAGLVTLIAPLIALGPSGGPPVPDVDVIIPWQHLGILVGEVGLVCVVGLLIVAAMTRRIHAATLLRQGQD